MHVACFTRLPFPRNPCVTSGDDKNYEDNSDAEKGERIDGVHLFYI